MIPVITSFSPLTGFPGDKITISGSGFTGATAVQFGGYDALTFRVVSDIAIEAYLGVDGTGIVSVTNPDGTGTLAGFTQQKIKKTIPDFPALGRDAVDDDKVLVWAESEAGTRYANVSDLPFSIGSGGGGGGSTTQLGSPFAVRVTDSSYYYDVDSGNTIITDSRLAGKTDYAVIATQLGGNEFDDNKLSFDAAAGSVTIAGFQLDPTAKIRIYADGVVNTTQSDFIANMTKEIATLKSMLAPVIPTALGPNGGKIWFVGDLTTLAGTGWQECIAMKGLYPLHRDGSDTDFSAAVGTPVGSKTFKLSSTDQLPKHSFFTVVDQFASLHGHPNDFSRAISAIKSMIRYYFKSDVPPNGGGEGYELCGQDETAGVQPTLSPTNSIGKATPDDIKHIPKSMMGTWIEYVGI